MNQLNSIYTKDWVLFVRVGEDGVPLFERRISHSHAGFSFDNSGLECDCLTKKLITWPSARNAYRES